MQSAYLSYRSSLLHYRLGGNGHKIIFCFHGYDEESGSFDFLEKFLASDFSFYAIDLPFHGQTTWKEGLNFTINDLTTIIKLILEQTGRANESFIVMGFSMGGRIALSLYEDIPNKVEKLVLLAPDGLKINFWYWLATQNRLGNRFFSFTMKYPGWFFGFLKIFNSLRLINTSVIRFTNHYIGDRDIRKLLYERWTALRRFKPNKSRIKSFVIEHRSKVDLVYGKYDRIILSPVGEKFRKGIEEYCSLTLIQSGHQVLQEKYAAEIIPLLLN